MPSDRDFIRSMLGIGDRIPDGTRGVRDVDAVCYAFVPGRPSGGGLGDGHYLCRECIQHDLEGAEEAKWK